MEVLEDQVYESRIKKIREKMKKKGLDGYVVFSNLSVNYLTGYNFIPTERPAAVLITLDNVDVTVPLLEKEAALSQEIFDRVYKYYDYPGNNSRNYHYHGSESPEEVIEEMVRNRDIENLGADMNGAPSVMGYEGPSLDEMMEEDISVEQWTEKMRIRKSEEEIEVLSQSAEYADSLFGKFRDYTEPGDNEVSLNLEMKKKAAEMVIEDQGSLSMSSRTLAYFRILSGSNTYNPHGRVKNREIREDDILLPGMAMAYGGYNAELERTMFMDGPTDKQKHYFGIMREAQEIAESAIAAEVKLSTVDQEVHDYFREQGVLENARHHTGHGLGLEGHEKPFIDRGNDGKLKKNMVISLEPGIYVEGAGGFRHSDTYVVKADGMERLTEDPRDLESNIMRK